jgi:3-oxoacyl-(acyl-carrier-protein) synthase
LILITGLGLVTPLGSDPATFAEALSQRSCALRPSPELASLPGARAGRVERVDLRSWLLRRKDRKLLSRAAQLALPAAGQALGDWDGDREQLGLFVGIGREPPDTGASEPSLAASARDGVLCHESLSTRGRELYPPLLPLLTLPNLVLSHVSINLGIRGENATVAGEAAAGAGALVEACYAVEEGRCPAALAGGADSRVDFGSARDLYRLGRAGPERLPGEGAVFLLVEPASCSRPALARIQPLRRRASTSPRPAGHWPLCGDLGAADGLLSLAGRLVQGRWGALTVSDDQGAEIELELSPP